MACKCAPALLQLRKEVDARWPGRDKASDGCCGDAAHASRRSDHNADASGFAHAEDIDENVVDQIDPQPLWALGITLLSDTRTKYLIYEGRLLYPDGTNKRYTGINAHEHHLHISIKPGTEGDTRRWLIPQEQLVDPLVQAHLFVNLLYHQYFTGAPDRAGVDYWVDLLVGKGKPYNDVKGFFIQVARDNGTLRK